MRVAVAGASGAVGVPLVRVLREAGHDVLELSRRAGVDVLDRESLQRAFAAAPPDVVVQQLTAFPATLGKQEMRRGVEQTNRLRTEGMQNLVATAPQARFISQSVAFAYRPEKRLHKEPDPLWFEGPRPAPLVTAAVSEMERTTLNTDGVVLRYGFFYGPGTWYHHDGAMAEMLRARRMPVIGRGRAVWSFCHVEDAAAAVLPVLAHGRGIYNVCDDDPAPVREWLPAFAEAIGAPKPRRVPRWVARLAGGPYAVSQFDEIQGASNRRFKENFAWRPEHPTWRDHLGMSQRCLAP